MAWQYYRTYTVTNASFWIWIWIWILVPPSWMQFSSPAVNYFFGLSRISGIQLIRHVASCTCAGSVHTAVTPIHLHPLTTVEGIYIVPMGLPSPVHIEVPPSAILSMVLHLLQGVKIPGLVQDPHCTTRQSQGPSPGLVELMEGSWRMYSLPQWG